MTTGRLREFRVSLNEAELTRCDTAGILPEEFVNTSIREALAALPELEEAVAEEEAPAVEEEEEEAEAPVEEDAPVAEEEETESDEAATY